MYKWVEWLLNTWMFTSCCWGILQFIVIASVFLGMAYVLIYALFF